MKKQEFIEKYGEEAYREHLLRNKKWREDNPDREKLRKKRYYQEHKEERDKKIKEWQLNNLEKMKEIKKEWFQVNSERVKEKWQEWYQDNKQKIIESNKKWVKQNPKQARASNLAKVYKFRDKEAEMDVSDNVRGKWIVNNIFNSSCIYCGDQDWTHLGCDRIDNTKPHTADNVVCSCFICNAERADKYSVEEFKKYRALHPRACDIPKAPAIQLSETGALKKRVIQVG